MRNEDSVLHWYSTSDSGEIRRSEHYSLPLATASLQSWDGKYYFSICTRKGVKRSWKLGYNVTITVRLNWNIKWYLAWEKRNVAMFLCCHVKVKPIMMRNCRASWALLLTTQYCIFLCEEDDSSFISRIKLLIPFLVSVKPISAQFSSSPFTCSSKFNFLVPKGDDDETEKIKFNSNNFLILSPSRSYLFTSRDARSFAQRRTRHSRRWGLFHFWE